MIKLNIDYKNKPFKQLNIDTHSEDAQRAFLIYDELLYKDYDGDYIKLKRLDEFLNNFIESNTKKTSTFKFKLKNLDFNVITVGEYEYKDIEYSWETITGRSRYNHEYLTKDEVKNIDMFIEPEDRELFFEDLMNPKTYFVLFSAHTNYSQIKHLQDNLQDEEYKEKYKVPFSFDNKYLLGKYSYEWKNIENKINSIIDKYKDDLEIIKNKNLVIDDASTSENIEQEEETIDFSKTNKRVMKM